MQTYYTTGSKLTGKASISSYVFTQIAQDTINDLLEGELKDKISMKNGRKKCRIETEIDKKNHATISIEIVAKKDSDPNKAISLIQQEVYDAVYDATEISSLKINVALLGFVD